MDATWDQWLEWRAARAHRPDVQGLLDELPIDEFVVVWLHVWEGRSFSECAVLMGVSRSAAHRLYTSALKRMGKESS